MHFRLFLIAYSLQMVYDPFSHLTPGATRTVGGADCQYPGRYRQVGGGAADWVADAFHSAMDSSSNIIGLFATRIAARPPDQNHPYGHRKAETFATFAIAVLLALACWEILSQAIARVHTPTPVQANLPSLIVMAVTIVINLAVSRYESERAKTLRSDLLTADAAQTRSDVFVSLSVLLSLAAASLGFAWVDIVMALVIAVLLGRTAYQIVLRSVAVLTDEAALDPRRIEQVVLSVPGVVLSHHIRSRGPADDIAIDLHVHVDPHLSLEQAHRITHQVTQALQQQFPGVRDVVVHLEPRRRTADEERDLFERVRDVVTNLHGSVRASAHNIRIQEVAGKLEVDLHLELEGEPTVEQAHEMASDLE